MENRPPLPTIEDAGDHWLSGHLYFDQHLDLVVAGFVQPLVTSLAREGLIAGFFFLRDGQAGPHVRLRLQAVAGAEGWVREGMQEAANEFLRHHTSKIVPGNEAVQRASGSIPSAASPEVVKDLHPNNSFQWIPFQPEVERYGGPGRIRHSLVFFTLSSVAAIESLADQGQLTRATQLARAFRLLLQQALCFAADEAEFYDLIRYGVDS